MKDKCRYCGVDFRHVPRADENSKLCRECRVAGADDGELRTLVVAVVARIILFAVAVIIAIRVGPDSLPYLGGFGLGLIASFAALFGGRRDETG